MDEVASFDVKNMLLLDVAAVGDIDPKVPLLDKTIDFRGERE